MFLSKRSFLTLLAAGAAAATLPITAQAADIKAMAESLVNLTVKDKNKLVFDGNLPGDVLTKAAGMPSQKRAAIYSDYLAHMLGEKLGDAVGKEATATLAKSIADGLDRIEESMISGGRDGEDRIMESINFSKDVSGTLTLQAMKQ